MGFWHISVLKLKSYYEIWAFWSTFQLDLWIWTQTWKITDAIYHEGNTWKGKYQNGSDMYHTLDLNMSHVSLKLIHFSDTCLKGIDFHKRNKVLCSSMQRSSLIPDASSPKSSLCNYPPPFNLQKNGLS